MLYLDHNATTPLDPRVLDAMLPWLRDKWGNASSRDHAYGWDARDAVEEARFQVAGLLNAGHHEIVFTSGATESIHIVLNGMFPPHTYPSGYPDPGGAPGVSVGGGTDSGLALSAVEHEALLGAAGTLKARGVPVDILGVDARGRLDPAALEGVLSARKPRLLALMAANNETGVTFPLAECAARAHAHGALFLTDAAQGLASISLDAAAQGFDFAALSAHKFYGPKGIGALYVRGGPAAIPLEPSLAGGGQEGGLRPGTLNVPAIVGFGEACRLALAERDGESARARGLRDRFEAELMARFPEVRVNGDREARLANTSNLLFPGADARTLIRGMHDVAASTRSACSSGASGPSHVLKAIGLADGDAYASIRFSLGRFTTAAEIDEAVAKCSAAYLTLRSSPGIA
ncbi:MAG: aminotransferase class [Fibrobacteres bacterium]|nr:aminotransferase class [Fibrobacterota bacterium]